MVGIIGHQILQERDHKHLDEPDIERQKIPQMKSNGRSTTRSLLDTDPNAPHVPDPSVKLVEFQASRKWRNRILRKLHLSIRNVHAQRRPPVSRQEDAIFVQRMALTLRRFCQWRIINMDETSWEVIDNHAYTVRCPARTGSRWSFVRRGKKTRVTKSLKPDV
jgi:hypothetical protein